MGKFKIETARFTMIRKQKSGFLDFIPHGKSALLPTFALDRILTYIVNPCCIIIVPRLIVAPRLIIALDLFGTLEEYVEICIQYFI